MRKRAAHHKAIDRRIAAFLRSASMVALVAALVTACGGIEGKIEAGCEAKIDVERVLREKHGADFPKQSQEECVREFEAVRKDHDRSGRPREFERELDAATERSKEIKEACENADRGDCD